VHFYVVEPQERTENGGRYAVHAAAAAV